MAKKRAFHPDQMALPLASAPQIATGPGSLAATAGLMARAVAEILKDDPRPREVIAAEMSVLLDEDISKMMLDAYASPARADFNISAHRLIALIVASGRIDILRRLLAPIGVNVVDGNGLLLAELGHLDRQEAEIRKRRRMLQSLAQPFSGDNSQ